MRNAAKQTEYYRELVRERYRPLFDSDHATAEVAARAHEIAHLHCCRETDAQGKIKMRWQKDVYQAASGAMKRNGFVPTYDYDSTKQGEVNAAFNFEGLQLVEMASLLVAEQESISGRVTPPALLASKLAAVIQNAYREMKHNYNFEKRGPSTNTGFKR